MNGSRSEFYLFFSLPVFWNFVECLNQILAEENNGVVNPEDAKPEEVEVVDKMEEGW